MPIAINAVWTYGSVELQFQWQAQRPPFDEQEKRWELAQRLNSIAGVEIPRDALLLRPSFSIELLEDEEAMNQFLATFEWCVEQMRASVASPE